MVGRLAGCRSLFTELTLTDLGLSKPEIECTNLKMQKSWKTRNPAAPKTHHETHSSPATATPGRRVTKHVPRQYSRASIDPGFVGIGLVQLSQSAKPTNVTHTDRQPSSIMAPCTHPGTSGEVNEARGGLILEAGRVRSKKKKSKKKNRKKNPPHLKHTTKSTAARQPRPMRDGMLGNTSHALAHTRPLP